MRRDNGFTLVELVMAMAIFSFMLSIIVTGFINIIRIHNASVAVNVVQDNAQTIIAALERDVRDSAAVEVGVDGGEPSLCIDGNQIITYDNTAHMLYTWQSSDNNCDPTAGTAVQLTSENVKVYYFNVTNDTPNDNRPTIRIATTIGSAGGTYTGTGVNTVCSGGFSTRNYCAITTITGSATPRGLDGAGS